MIEIGDSIYIPAVKLGVTGNGRALYHAKVLQRKPDGRSVKVELPEGDSSDWIGTSLCHKNVGIYVVQIGDYETEISLLEPLTKSILHFFRVMFDDDAVRVARVRSRAELSRLWNQDHGAYSHVILIGHGRGDAVQFGVDGWVAAGDIANDFSPSGLSPKVFISLCCQTGRAAFGRPFSMNDACSALIAPFQSVHGAVASLFTQSYFGYHFLEGLGDKSAFNRVRSGLPGGASFKYWERGNASS